MKDGVGLSRRGVRVRGPEEMEKKVLIPGQKIKKKKKRQRGSSVSHRKLKLR